MNLIYFWNNNYINDLFNGSFKLNCFQYVKQVWKLNKKYPYARYFNICEENMIMYHCTYDRDIKNQINVENMWPMWNQRNNEITHAYRLELNADIVDKIDLVDIFKPHLKCMFGHNFRVYYLNNKFVGVGGVHKIYFLESKDGIEWTLLHDNYIDRYHEKHYKFYKTRFFEQNGYDSISSMLFINNKYYLYHRANLGEGVRHVAYTTSTDLKSWDPWKLINVEGYCPENDFYYLSNITRHPFDDSLYLNICPNSNNNLTHGDENISFLISKDGINWKKIHNNIIPKTCRGFPVCHKLFVADGTMYQYFCNYDTNSIELYKIDQDRFGYVTNNGNEECTFTTCTLWPKNVITIHYTIDERGYIKVYLNDNESCVNLNKNIEIERINIENNNGTSIPISLRFEFKCAKIYCAYLD